MFKCPRDTPYGGTFEVCACVCHNRDGAGLDFDHSFMVHHL